MQLDLEIITKEIKHKNQLIAEVFSLCITYGYSISEIAEELRMPERKVRYLIDLAKEIAKKVNKQGNKADRERSSLPFRFCSAVELNLLIYSIFYYLKLVKKNTQ
ncbi:MAG: hypothetical protein PUB15_03170 [Ruminobacter sp.]|nr:hypothetical protein [Ruminobacter sp.]